MDPDSQKDKGEYIKTLTKDEKLSEQTDGERIVWLNASDSGIPMPSRLFRNIWNRNENFQSYLRWYSSCFLPIVWVVFLGLYLLIF